MQYLLTLTYRDGVTSNAGFSTVVPVGATCRPNMCVTSADARCSMGIWSPEASVRSSVEIGAATKNGTPFSFARTATEYVPTLLATSPFAAIRSAPTTTQPIRPAFMK